VLEISLPLYFVVHSCPLLFNHSHLLQGISLSSCKKLSQIKLNSGENAQHYVLSKLLARVPESLELVQDLPTIEEARTINLPRLLADLKKLEECLTILQELIVDEKEATKTKETNKAALTEQEVKSETAKPIEEEGNKAINTLLKYQSEISKYYETAKIRLTSGISDFNEVCRYYGEATGEGESTFTIDPEQFFGEIIGLMKAIQQVTSSASGKHRRKALVS
jgi:vacuolar-type H+-ATPase subunit I/STV1